MILFFALGGELLIHYRIYSNARHPRGDQDMI